jgi:hypothetical protein
MFDTANADIAKARKDENSKGASERLKKASQVRGVAVKGLMQGDHNHWWPGIDAAFSKALKQLLGPLPVYSGVRRPEEPLALHLGGRNGGNSSCAIHSRILGSPFPVKFKHKSGPTNNVAEATAASAAVCPRSVIGDAPGRWTRFDAERICKEDDEDSPFHNWPRVLPGPSWLLRAQPPTFEEALAREPGLTLSKFELDKAKFKRAVAAPASANMSEVLKRSPECASLHLKGNVPKMGPGQGPSEYEDGGWVDLEWQPDRCSMKHYTRAETRQCFVRRNISTVCTQGDSVMALFRATLLWLVGTESSDKSDWYDTSSGGGSKAERSFKGDVAIIHPWELEEGGVIKGKDGDDARMPHIVKFVGYPTRMTESDPVGWGSTFIDDLGLPSVHAGGKSTETVVLVSNFGIHHLLWRHTVYPWLEAMLKGFAHGVKQRLASLASHRQVRGFKHLLLADDSSAGISSKHSSDSKKRDAANINEASSSPTVELIAMLPSAVHGFREPYVTLPRSTEAARLIKKWLGGQGDDVKSSFSDEGHHQHDGGPSPTPHQRQGGGGGGAFRIMDIQALELGRPEMSADGLHYSDAMNYNQVQLFVSMLCNEES